MIDITLRSGKYTLKRLKTALGKYFEDERDSSLFIESLLKTGQITKEKRRYVIPQGKKETYSTARKHRLSTYYYGGRGRVGVRGGKDWVGDFGYPSNMVLDRVRIKGKWIDIKEKPKLVLVKGRSPEGKEAWRAQIPASIQQSYSIMPDTPIDVNVTETTSTFFSRLKLWGYQYEVLIAYGETKKSANTRFLEIEGQNFTNNVGMDIHDTIERDQRQIKATILKLLDDADSNYYDLYAETETAGKSEESVKAIPVLKRNPLFAKIRFQDLQNMRTIVEWDTLKEHSKIPKTSDFKATSNIDAARARSRGQTLLDVKWKNRGGF